MQRLVIALTQQIKRLENKRKCSWLEDDGKEVGHRQCGICNSWYGWVAMFWALDVWDDMRMLYEDLAMKM